MKKFLIIFVLSISFISSSFSYEESQRRSFNNDKKNKSIIFADNDSVWINMMGGSYEYNSGNPYHQPWGIYMKYPKNAIKYCKARDKKTFHVTGDFISWYAYVTVKNYGFVRFICAKNTKEVKIKLIELINKDTKINVGEGDKISKKFNKIRKKESKKAIKQISKNGIPWGCEVEYFGNITSYRTIKPIKGYKLNQFCKNMEKPYFGIYERYSFLPNETNIVLFNEDPKIELEKNKKIADKKRKEEFERKEKERLKKLEKDRIENERRAKIEEEKRKEEIAIEEEKRKKEEAEEFKILEAKFKRKCLKSIFNKDGYEIDTPEYRFCIITKAANSIDEKEKNKKEIKKAKIKKETTIDENINPNLIAIGSGSAFFINNKGYALTNDHVVGICQQLVSVIDGNKVLFKVISTDSFNDVAIISMHKRSKNYLKINDEGADLGEDIIAFGYPLAGQLSDSVKLTRGIVSALSGIENNIGQIQIDAALQPGNSGGPVLNRQGEVIGIASAGLNKLLMAKKQQTIPENVNFAVASPIVTNFLKSKKIKYTTQSIFGSEYSTTELAEIGSETTFQLLCMNTKTAYNKYRNNDKYKATLLDLN